MNQPRLIAPQALRLPGRAALPSSVMVLAAGLGRRMRPLTDHLPKPLVPVAGKPLIDWALDNARAAGLRQAVVNTHYLGDALQAHLATHPSGLKIDISDEHDALLETGGGVARALQLIDADPFYVMNADNIWVSGPMECMAALAQHWHADRMDALLLMVPLNRAHGYDGPGDFSMDPLGRLARRRENRIAPFVFSGMQILRKALFDEVPQGAFSLNIIFNRALERGRLYGLVHDGLWFHVGTPEAVTDTQEMLRGE